MKCIVLFIFALFSGLTASAQVECEDTCSHIHGIDMSHYQGDVFWEAIGENAKMAYVYLKATEGGDNIDSKYKRNEPLDLRNYATAALEIANPVLAKPEPGMAQRTRRAGRRRITGGI